MASRFTRLPVSLTLKVIANKNSKTCYKVKRLLNQRNLLKVKYYVKLPYLNLRGMLSSKKHLDGTEGGVSVDADPTTI